MAQTNSTRYLSIDALRGLIMIVMALDHAAAYAARQHGVEFWAGAMSLYTSAFPFLTRWVTHLCAPGFFFLMGAGAYWYAAARTVDGRTLGASMGVTVKRGLILLAIAQLLEMPVLYVQSLLSRPAVSLARVTAPPPIDGSSFWWMFATLTGLGLVLVACGVLLRLRPWMWLVVSALCVVATHTLLPASGQPGPLWFTVLLAPGLSQHVMVVFPMIPWLAVAAAGMYFGYWWRKHPDTAARRVWIVGAALLLTGIAVRYAGGWGNIRPPRDASWIEFLNNVKYPPSLAFWTMAVGLDLLLLALIARIPALVRSARSPLLVFGQSPLFFYLAHLAALAVAGLTLFRQPVSLEAAYLAWIALLVVMYPLCRLYRDFKLSKPSDSVWRLL